MKKQYPIELLQDPNFRQFHEKYCCDKMGNVYRIHKYIIRQLTPYYCNRRWNVDIDGKRYTVMRLIASVWGLKCPEGHVYYHINGLKDDNRLANIGTITPRELGLKTGHKGMRRPVIKIQYGEIVGFYRSARQCALENYYTPKQICNICNKKGTATDGCRYEWDE